MAEKRICPICGNEIPEGSSYYCPRCGFPLEKMNEEEAIERAKQYFTGIMTNPKLRPTASPKDVHKPSTKLFDHALKEIVTLIIFLFAGMLGELIVLIILVAGNSSDYFSAVIGFFLYSPIGILCGYSGYALEKIFNKFFRKRYVFYLLTIILSVVIFFIILIVTNLPIFLL